MIGASQKRQESQLKRLKTPFISGLLELKRKISVTSGFSLNSSLILAEKKMRVRAYLAQQT